MSVETKNPATGTIGVVAKAVKTPESDPSRRADVLFRVRREPGHEMSSWWPISAFVVVSTVVVVMLRFIPGGQ